ncbi:hypothetical protein SCLCIDRAFT_25044 [Scleroderma citrinum Foug A]|uniref:Uncharacterized protein n=1 Tax=Scleroderma citrinum Foug A TaxID=1036808 RepID=A0A0C3E2K3_9AGAM|nr:hypothetical protein SCLCIDRAFT_25044 [Scleroderma citrinum Foug A]
MSTPISMAELSHTNLSRILTAACNQLNGHEGKTVQDEKTLVPTIPSQSSAFDAIEDLGAGHLMKK